MHVGREFGADGQKGRLWPVTEFVSNVADLSCGAVREEESVAGKGGRAGEADILCVGVW